MELKISLAGDLGSGKSTVSDIIVKETGAEYYSTGRICREVAARYGMNVVEMNTYMETHPEIDHEIDDGIAALSDVDKKMIIDSRMAWHFVRDTFKVYLTTDLKEAAHRIYNAGRATESFASEEETAEKIRARRRSEARRYMDLYGVNCKDLSNYSLVLDTTHANPREVADRILSAAEMWELDHAKKMCYICPDRLYFPADGEDLAYVHDLACLLDYSADIPQVEVTECDGDFYVTGGTASALAYVMNDETFVPCRLSVGERPHGDFIKISHSLSDLADAKVLAEHEEKE